MSSYGGLATLAVPDEALGPKVLPVALRPAPVQARNRAVHRAFDVGGALLLGLLLTPIIVVISLAVGVSSPGGVLYRQTRVGADGREFVMLKFRSMYEGGHARRGELAALDNGNGVLFKIRRDPRVTPVGRVLRRTSMDELPQLLNVLRGQMSLVGPRPALPEEVALYSDVERGRLRSKPGMTGLWQVSGRADLPWDECIRLDLHYVRHASLLLDMRILVRTVVAVVSGRGAY